MASTTEPPTPESPTPGMASGASVADLSHVALIGLMGAGKTAVGRALAATIGRRHVDLDRAITQLAGRSIGVIFHEGGESSFRDLEAECLAIQLAGHDPIVLSTGGGVLIRDQNRAALVDGATVVWLRARPETLADRVGSGVGRPLLEGRNPLEVLRDLADERHPIYAAAADLVVDTDDRSVDELARSLAGALGGADAPGQTHRVGDRS